MALKLPWIGLCRHGNCHLIAYCIQISTLFIQRLIYVVVVILFPVSDWRSIFSLPLLSPAVSISLSLSLSLPITRSVTSLPMFSSTSPRRPRWRRWWRITWRRGRSLFLLFTFSFPVLCFSLLVTSNIAFHDNLYIVLINFLVFYLLLFYRFGYFGLLFLFYRRRLKF